VNFAARLLDELRHHAIPASSFEAVHELAIAWLERRDVSPRQVVEFFKSKQQPTGDLS
jgi:hypothetical protein